MEIRALESVLEPDLLVFLRLRFCNDTAMGSVGANENDDRLCQSDDPDHPANLIPRLCRQFYSLGIHTD